MCRVCQKRPEIPGERYGRCEACARAQRVAYRFRLGPARGGGLAVRAGELSPRALHQKLHTQLPDFAGRPTTRPHLTLHDVELMVAKDRLEAIRMAPALAGQEEAVVGALRAAVERTEAGW